MNDLVEKDKASVGRSLTERKSIERKNVEKKYRMGKMQKKLCFIIYFFFFSLLVYNLFYNFIFMKKIKNVMLVEIFDIFSLQYFSFRHFFFDIFPFDIFSFGQTTAQRSVSLVCSSKNGVLFHKFILSLGVKHNRKHKME